MGIEASCEFCFMSFDFQDWKRAHLDTEKSLNASEKYGNIPAIPADIGYKSGKKTSGSAGGGVVQHAMGNPGVVLGMGLTALALLGMMRSSFLGDKLGAQKYMRLVCLLRLLVLLLCFVFVIYYYYVFLLCSVMVMIW
ncbi:unnamed protein product [Anisakis simplex]|uniref:Transmembrane protein n=1 Tax=Anisakis simplex TaxID=6269 RepID=A0A0M3JGT7_ANISI|nr:unnamed protein product [Anisakis simplex]